LSLKEAARHVADGYDVSFEEAKALLEVAFRDYSLSAFSDSYQQVQGWQSVEIDWENSAVVGSGDRTIDGVRYAVTVILRRQHLDEWMDIDDSVKIGAKVVSHGPSSRSSWPRSRCRDRCSRIS
jgi:hypothetical protein